VVGASDATSEVSTEGIAAGGRDWEVPAGVTISTGEGEIGVEGAGAEFGTDGGGANAGVTDAGVARKAVRTEGAPWPC
jgi:hypothetical protein